MSKLIVISYSFLILFQSFNINIEDIPKFSALIEHANYHNEMYGDNFFEFLSEHYGEQMTSHQNKHKEHEELPFKDDHHICSHVNTSFTLFKSIVFPLNAAAAIDTPVNFFYKEPFSLFEKESVFQPPKLA